MSQVQCLPVSGKNMSKVKKIIEEASAFQTREIDLVDRNIHSFDEIPTICESSNAQEHAQIWNKINIYTPRCLQLFVFRPINGRSFAFVSF
jgi:hypothetical protein